MKKLLILAYDFPPYVSVGGLRPYNWYRYLKAFGVEPIVVTRQWGNVHGNHLDYIVAGSSDQDIVEESEFGTIIRTPYSPNIANRLMLKYGEKNHRILRKSISAYYEVAQFLAPIGPKVGLYEGARTYLKTHKVDAIIATGDPFILFSYASKLSKEFGIPWIADYRDPWSHNQEHRKNVIQKKWNSYFEKKIVSTASHIRTVSKFVHSKIDQLIPNKPYSITPNGYDTAYHSKLVKSQLGKSNSHSPILNKASNAVLICSCSSLIPLKRVDVMIKVLAKLKLGLVHWVHFGDGPLRIELENLADKYEVSFEFQGNVSNDEILKYYAANYVDIFINLSSSEGIPVSIMEAQSASIPVLALDVGGCSEIVNDENGFPLPKEAKSYEIAKIISNYLSSTNAEKAKKRKLSYDNWGEKFNAKKNYTEFTEMLSQL